MSSFITELSNRPVLTEPALTPPEEWLRTQMLHVYSTEYSHHTHRQILRQFDQLEEE